MRNSMKKAESLKIEGAPALFVEGERIGGALPQDQLWMVIDRALRAAGVEPPAAPRLSPRPPGQQGQTSSRRLPLEGRSQRQLAGAPVKFHIATPAWGFILNCRGAFASPRRYQVANQSFLPHRLSA